MKKQKRETKGPAVTWTHQVKYDREQQCYRVFDMEGNEVPPEEAERVLAEADETEDLG